MSLVPVDAVSANDVAAAIATFLEQLPALEKTCADFLDRRLRNFEQASVDVARDIDLTKELFASPDHWNALQHVDNAIVRKTAVTVMSMMAMLGRALRYFERARGEHQLNIAAHILVVTASKIRLLLEGDNQHPYDMFRLGLYYYCNGDVRRETDPELLAWLQGGVLTGFRINAAGTRPRIQQWADFKFIDADLKWTELCNELLVQFQ